MNLSVLWFLLIAVLWTGYFVLDGFDFGVGILLPILGRDEATRRVLINTIGPVWDGNEVWLLVAGGATFAAFPEWYASLFSGFYLPLLLILVALIIRGVAFEFRGKIDDAAVEGPLGCGDLRRQHRTRAAVGRRVRQHRARRQTVRPAPLRRIVLRPAQPVRAARRRRHPRLFTLHGAVFLALKTTDRSAPTLGGPRAGSVRSRSSPARDSCCGRSSPTAMSARGHRGRLRALR